MPPASGLQASGPRLALRTDAGVSIGAGHAMRCLALAEAFAERGGRSTFIVAEGASWVSSRSAAAHDCCALACEPGSTLDAQNSAREALARGASWIVVDGYRFGARYEAELRDLGLSVLAIDDHAQAGAHGADVLLDQNLGAKREAYASTPAHTRFLLGSEYVMLRKELRLLAHQGHPTPERAQHVLVTMGAADEPNLTARVLAAMTSAFGAAATPRTIAVCGPLNPHRADLEQLVRSMGSRVELKVDAANMAELLTWADVAVAAGGSTCWELCLFGVPQLVLPWAANQQPIARALAARGAAIDLGPADVCQEGAIAGALRALVADQERRSQMAAAARATIDGRGVERVLDALGFGASPCAPRRG